MQISVAGNIGSGKTTLTSLLAKHYGWEAHFEDTQDNPYLNDFYEDMQRWSFNLQIYFLQNRYNNVMRYRESGKNVIMDRTIYEDAYIFAPNLHSMNLMSKRDFDNYIQLFDLTNSLVKAPDLLIYLRSSVPNLVDNIQKRGREYETSIRLDYLNRLNERYEAWISEYNEGKLLIIDVDNNHFPTNQEDLGEVISKIDAQINGLF
ncbi:deoxynucleoside kinase [Flavobacteriales bacterium]|jgi:deoxyadenosine/deoxycytidine kinase|nr:deoxynucleoside kinase [Flavobacteriales bacterium]MDG1518754.1 deoxynucleoside kinase [Flavobacteriales bacterium]